MNSTITQPVSENAELDETSPRSRSDGLYMRDESGCKLSAEGDGLLAETKWGTRGWRRPSCILVTVILILTALVVLLDYKADKHSSDSTHFDNDCGLTHTDNCRINLVETIPFDLANPNHTILHPSVYQSWMHLIASAQSSIEIVTFHFQMRKLNSSPNISAKEGEDVFKGLVESGRDRGIAIKILRDIQLPVERQGLHYDVEYLSEKANAQVRALNFTTSTGPVILHSKLLLIDRTHFYIGSSNMEWFGLSYFKQLGVQAVNCSCLAKDIAKIFDVYWKLSDNGTVPTTLIDSLTTKINVDNPVTVTTDDNKYRVFITRYLFGHPLDNTYNRTQSINHYNKSLIYEVMTSSSPPPISTRGRTDDLDAILHCINNAEKFIYIARVTYIPLIMHAPKIKYWPVIDDALRSAAIDRRVHVRLLVMRKKGSSPVAGYFLKSLAALTKSYENVKIEVKIFIIPANAEIDESGINRSNHHKYIVTDGAVHIGTSNLSGDYFINSTGIGMVIEDVEPNNEGSIRQQLEDIFLRDWNSQHAHPLEEIYPDNEIA